MEILNDEFNQETSESEKTRGKYQKYSQESLTQALNDIKGNKLTVYAAAKINAVPISTLMSRLTNVSVNKNGREPTLSIKAEENLAEWLIKCAEIGDPRTRDELMSTAGKLATTEDKTFKNNTPSSQWLKGFLKRNPNISFRTPSTISRASANVSSNDILNYIVGVQSYLEKIGKLHLLDDPTAWGNSDETGIDLNPVPSQVLAQKGGKNVYRVETAKPKERVSVMYTFLASGDMLTPQLILKESISTIADVAFACGGKTMKMFFCIPTNFFFYRSRNKIRHQFNSKRIPNARFILRLCHKSSCERARREKYQTHRGSSIPVLRRWTHKSRFV